jgi:aminopeptidase N
MITLGMTEYTTSTPVLVHEIAHHWWGDLIGPTTWRDLWMNEGMVMYLQGAWMASEEPYTLQQLMDYWAQDEPQMRAEAGPAADYDPATFGEGNAYYSGALMWHEIRGLLGDREFWRLVREWPQSMPYGSSDYDGIVGWWSRESGRDLAPVFDAWLLGETSPPR